MWGFSGRILIVTNLSKDLCFSDGQTDTTTTDQSASPAYSSPGIVNKHCESLVKIFKSILINAKNKPKGEEGDTDQLLDSADEEFSG